jgi:hypothetical protein
MLDQKCFRTMRGSIFRAGEEGQKDRAESGEEIDPVGDLQADEVAGDRADDNFDQRHGDGDPDGNERRQQRQSKPQGGLKPNTRHDPSPVRAAGTARQESDAHRAVRAR